jgi:hypothetical protein
MPRNCQIKNVAFVQNIRNHFLDQAHYLQYPKINNSIPTLSNGEILFYTNTD